jgi:phenylacetic acid degradation operon negative regulatory protein
VDLHEIIRLTGRPEPALTPTKYSLQKTSGFNEVVSRTRQNFICCSLSFSGSFASMNSKTQELLYLLLWAGEAALRPTFRNLTESFEQWAYRNGLNQQLAALEKQRLVESQGERPADRIHRLTEAGRLVALGGRDPVAQWKRRWDGKWRMILFDVPQQRASARARLRRSLAKRGFGYLQNSVWITPDPLVDERAVLGSGPVDVESLLLLEARPCAGESDAAIVAGAWDFEAINAAYDRHEKVLMTRPNQSLTNEAVIKPFHRWLGEERLAWKEAMDLDPLLPEVLHPPGYCGRIAWKRRLQALAKAGRQTRSFRHA